MSGVINIPSLFNSNISNSISLGYVNLNDTYLLFLTSNILNLILLLTILSKVSISFLIILTLEVISLSESNLYIGLLSLLSILTIKSSTL